MLTWIEIDTAAVRHNLDAFRSLLPKGTSLMVVVKANAYGHGIRRAFAGIPGVVTRDAHFATRPGDGQAGGGESPAIQGDGAAFNAAGRNLIGKRWSDDQAGARRPWRDTSVLGQHRIRREEHG